MCKTVSRSDTILRAEWTDLGDAIPAHTDDAPPKQNLEQKYLQMDYLGKGEGGWK